MRDGQAQPAAALEHPARLGDGVRHPVDVVQAHIGHHEVERLVREGQRGRVADHGRRRAVVTGRQPHHGRCGVDPGHPVTERLQEPAEPALAAGQVQGPAARRGQQFEQGGQVSVVVPAVVAGRTGEGRPVAGLRLPAIPHPHPPSVAQRAAGGQRGE